MDVREKFMENGQCYLIQGFVERNGNTSDDNDDNGG
jgi:hypothetical protein